MRQPLHYVLKCRRSHHQLVDGVNEHNALGVFLLVWAF